MNRIYDIVKKAYTNKMDRGWDYIYIAIDLHDTIIRSTYKNDDSFDIYTSCGSTLKYLSDCDEIKLILFTSSHKDYVDKFFKFMQEYKIKFDYFNENPECVSTATGNFDKKFYYNILIDDKAGFDPEQDWITLLQSVRYFRMKEALAKK